MDPTTAQTDLAAAMSTAVMMFRGFEGWLLGFLLCLPRAYAFIAASQLLPPTAVPRLARTASILVIALPITPVVAPQAQTLIEGEVARLLLYFAKEFAIGFVMGFFVTWVFWAVQAAGAFIDNQRGAAIAASIDPLQGHESSPLGLLFSQGFITYFFAVGGFTVIVGLLYNSFQIWPVTRMLPVFAEDFPATIFALLDLGMRLMFIYAAPIIAVMFLAEFALALVSRFAPQVQVFILAMPIKSGIAVFLLIFYLPILMRQALGEAGDLEAWMARLWSILEAGTGLR
ncbi:type III secretion system export apparatus subunit SctT [Marivita sp. S0852]